MNVFYLDKDPVVCAEMHNDKHVVKMLVEYAQLMSTAHRIIDGEHWEGRTTNGRRIARFFHPDSAMQHTLYKATHMNHPSAVWLRESAQNYTWLYDMWTALHHEFEHRYGKSHLSFTKLEYYLISPPEGLTGASGFTDPPPAMGQFPDCIVPGDSINSYRNYYKVAKKSFAVWTKRDTPYWWK